MEASHGSNGSREAKAGPRVPLDWSRLLGFDQAGPADGCGAPRARLARVGVKVGAKPGLEPKTSA